MTTASTRSSMTVPSHDDSGRHLPKAVTRWQHAAFACGEGRRSSRAWSLQAGRHCDPVQVASCVDFGEVRPGLFGEGLDVGVPLREVGQDQSPYTGLGCDPGCLRGGEVAEPPDVRPGDTELTQLVRKHEAAVRPWWGPATPVPARP